MLSSSQCFHPCALCPTLRLPRVSFGIICVRFGYIVVLSYLCIFHICTSGIPRYGQTFNILAINPDIDATTSLCCGTGVLLKLDELHSNINTKQIVCQYKTYCTPTSIQNKLHITIAVCRTFTSPCRILSGQVSVIVRHSKFHAFNTTMILGSQMLF